MRLTKVVELLKNNNTFLISAHQNPEGDAIGSQLGMYHLLKQMKKRVYIYNHDPVPQNLQFLPGARHIKTDDPGRDFDVGIVLDCSDLSRLGSTKPAFERTKVLVNIDHHVSNTRFGDVNAVDPDASSASELVARLYRRMFATIDRYAALCLYTGIFTDTGAFTYSYTSAAVHRLVSELLACGVKPDQVYRQVYSSLSAEDIQFVGTVLSTVRHDEGGRIYWAAIPRWRESAGGDLTETIFHSMGFLKNAEVFILFKKIRSGAVRVNFRSRGKVDVNRIARFFGGGGHKKASGTTIEDPSLASVQKHVIDYVKKYI